MRLRRSLPALLTLALLSACGGDDDTTITTTTTPTSADVLAPGPLGVGVATLFLVDATRPTMPSGPSPGLPRRSLVTEIWYPAAPSAGAPALGQRNAALDTSGGKYPLVVYSHGFSDQRTGGGYLGRHLASHGYIVAAPDFPLTHLGVAGGPNGADLVNQPGDVSFIIDTLLADKPDNRFAGAVDAQRIGLAGLSLGGLTTSLATFHPALHDRRVRAAVTVAGPACRFSEKFYDNADVPLLLLHGDIDAIVAYEENSVYGYGKANAPKYLMTIVGGSHTAFTELASAIIDQLENPDELGCQTLGGGPPRDDPPEESPATDLGGEENGIIDGVCPDSCRGFYPPAVRGPRQRQLTILGAYPFFEAYLRGRSEMQAFLEQHLVPENAEVELEFQK